MIQSRAKLQPFIFTIGLYLFGILGCTGVQTTQPNHPYQGVYPSSIEKLRQTNPLLIMELGKLPEILDGISEIESIALEKIVTVYFDRPSFFNDAFHIMYRVGIPEVRKYCTLLQTLFWYALDHQEQQISNYLEYYDGESIDPEYPFLETLTVSFLLSDTWNFKDQNRWGNPQMVIDRLNAPELFEYWFAMVFIYDFSKKYRPAPVWGQPAETSIRTRKGVCYDAANLARVCLLKAGYKATGLNVVFTPSGRTRAHSVCVMEIETNKGIRFIKVGDTKRPGALGVAHASIKDMAFRIADGYGSYLLGYTAGFPGFNSFR